MTAADRFTYRDDVSDAEFESLRERWLSRVMFNQFVGWEKETRTLDEFIDAERKEPQT